VSFSVPPTGTECIRSQQQLKLSNLIRKIISDKIARTKGTDLKAKSARAAMALGLGGVGERSPRRVCKVVPGGFSSIWSCDSCMKDAF
jgi:hypothetical protein